MSESTPICRCRVLYLGSSVPQQTKDGLQGIQEPLQELYPDQGATGARGIDSWLSVWSNGILLENVDENHKKITRFFPIESLHYCAAVRYVLVPEKNTLHTPSPRFLPLDSPFARTPNPVHPPLFAAILRRTTGIKVLECHAFICKREVAANALVRCCFHAYADSSYAKQVDTAGSIYGTLASDRISKEKVEDWKMNRSQSGSTMTINTIGKSNDEISIYNGDENHKVWAGSQDNIDQIYDVYSSSTISRPSRPRQITAPVTVPPPPPPPSSKEKSATNKKQRQMKNRISNGNHHHHHQQQQKEELYASSGLLNGKANSVSGTMLKQGRIPQNLQQQPIYIMTHHPHQTLPNPKFMKHGNTFSHRPRGKMLIPARPIPPPLVPVPASVILPPTTMTNKKNKNKTKRGVAEEPIYMPSNRAMSPVASYQPVNFPHEAYLMQHYATMESPKHNKQRQQQQLQQQQLQQQQLQQQLQHQSLQHQSLQHQQLQHQQLQHQQLHQREKSLEKQQQISSSSSSKMNKKLTQSMNGLDDPNLIRDDEGGSPFNTGIYRKKGHLNERAFSYSIRQEHRSRSYGSLANLKFATPIPNGVDVEDREDIKKEREIMQMVHDLDLSGDEIERSEVPRAIYEARGPPPGSVIVTPAQINGKGYRR